MPDYEKMYHRLFNAITDAIELMEADKIPLAASILRQAQISTEEIYLDEE